MKKLLSIILTITILCSMAIIAFADDTAPKTSATSVSASKWAADSKDYSGYHRIYNSRSFFHMYTSDIGKIYKYILPPNR